MSKTRGTSKIFTEQGMKQLEENPNVRSVTEKGTLMRLVEICKPNNSK